MLKRFEQSSKSIGFVPTMGALHLGHLSLVKQGLDENDVVVVSIFVNPTQFNNSEDLKKYPRHLDRDIELLNDLKNSSIIIFAPDVNDVYTEDISVRSFEFHGLEAQMEGAFRPGHFDGVATIVSILFQIVQPQNAYFGEKDFQQLLIIKAMVNQLRLPVNIVSCPIYREEDGLAMSSRNQRLTTSQRLEAPLIYKVLKAAKTMFGTENAAEIEQMVASKISVSTELTLEYFVIADGDHLEPIVEIEKNKKYRAFIAVFAGEVRLIDNIALN